MKRARRGRGASRQRTAELFEKNRRAPDLSDYRVNREDDIDFQMKYYGEVQEEEVEEQTEVLSEQHEEPAEVLNKAEQIGAQLADVLPENADEGEALPDAESEDNEGAEETKDKSFAEDTNGKKQKSSFSFKKFSLIFCVSLFVIVVVSIAAMTLGGMFTVDNTELTSEHLGQVDEKMGKVNVLLLGVDKEGLRTDTIIVASFDTDDNTVNMLSIPRDTRMYIGSRYQKINAAHALSKKNGKITGPEGTIEAVTRLTGIPINYYIEFSFDAFRDTVDALGGVYFDVPHNMNYEDPVQDLYIHLKKGYQLLDGDKAEQLVRFRRYPQGDIKRVEVQQAFIKAVAEQKLNASIITKVPELYKSLSENIKTNATLGDITKYANKLLKLDLNNLAMYELPGNYSEGQFAASYWLANMRDVRILVETVFGYDTSDVTLDKAKAGAVYGKEADPANLPKLESLSDTVYKGDTSTKKEEPIDDEGEFTAPPQIDDEDEEPDNVSENDEDENKDEDNDTLKRPSSNSTNPSQTKPSKPASSTGVTNQRPQANTDNENNTPNEEPAVNDTHTPQPEPEPEPVPEPEPQENNGGFTRPGAN